MEKIGKIYGLVHDDKLIYIGSTFLSLGARLNAHKSAARCGANSPIYRYMRECGTCNIHIRMLEYHVGIDKSELVDIEQSYLTRHDGLLNKNSAVIKDHKLYMREYMRGYAQIFKERHHDKLNAAIRCDDCGDFFKYKNRAYHPSSKTHKKIVDHAEQCDGINMIEV